MGNYQGREVGLGGGCLSQCVRAKKNFWGPGKFCRLSWDQGFECVTGTGSQKKTFGAPESFVGFCGTRAFTPRPETGSWHTDWHTLCGERLMLMCGCYYYVVLKWIRTCQSCGPLDAHPTCIATRGEEGCCHSHTMASLVSVEIYAHCRPLTWQWHYLGGIVCCILLGSCANWRHCLPHWTCMVMQRCHNTLPGS